MIRDKFYKDIVSTIDKHPRFDSSDFRIETSKTSTFTNLSIGYSLESKYKIHFKIPTSVSREKDGYRQYYSFSGNVCPGPLSYEESFSFEGTEGVYSKITDWLNCIWEELTSNPVVKTIENQQAEIEKIIEKFDNLEDTFFSKEEADDLKKRLDELEKKLKSEIQQRVEDKKEADGEIQKLSNDIDTLKQTVESLKRKSWLKSFTGKVFKWTKDSDNRKLLKDGYKVIREFLPESFKNSLPE